MEDHFPMEVLRKHPADLVFGLVGVPLALATQTLGGFLLTGSSEARFRLLLSILTIAVEFGIAVWLLICTIDAESDCWHNDRPTPSWRQVLVFCLVAVLALSFTLISVTDVERRSAASGTKPDTALLSTRTSAASLQAQPELKSAGGQKAERLPGVLRVPTALILAGVLLVGGIGLALARFWPRDVVYMLYALSILVLFLCVSFFFEFSRLAT